LPPQPIQPPYYRIIESISSSRNRREITPKATRPKVIPEMLHKETVGQNGESDMRKFRHVAAAFTSSALLFLSLLVALNALSAGAGTGDLPWT
jgi:hypothetical protein